MRLEKLYCAGDCALLATGSQRGPAFIVVDGDRTTVFDGVELRDSFRAAYGLLRLMARLNGHTVVRADSAWLARAWCFDWLAAAAFWRSRHAATRAAGLGSYHRQSWLRSFNAAQASAACCVRLDAPGLPL